jgi:hypothetical protein
MAETLFDLLVAAHEATEASKVVAARSRLAHALSVTGPVLFRGIIYKGTFADGSPPTWRVQGDAARVLEMMVSKDEPINTGGDEATTQFRPDLLPPEPELAKLLNVPLASDVVVPEGI